MCYMFYCITRCGDVPVMCCNSAVCFKLCSNTQHWCRGAQIKHMQHVQREERVVEVHSAEQRRNKMDRSVCRCSKKCELDGVLGVGNVAQTVCVNNISVCAQSVPTFELQFNVVAEQSHTAKTSFSLVSSENTRIQHMQNLFFGCTPTNQAALRHCNIVNRCCPCPRIRK